MDNKRNFYRLLQVQPDAPEEIIRASYRTLMQKLRMHPDLGGDASHAALLNQAYEILTDKRKRAAYDRQLTTSLRSLRDRTTGRQAADSRHPAGKRTSQCPFCRVNQPRLNSNNANQTCVSCRSPLQLPAKINSSGQGNRRIHRIPQNGKIHLVATWPQKTVYPASIDDLSPGGLQLQCRLKLAPEQMVKLFNANLQAIGKVVHCQPGNTAGFYCTGIEFVTLRFENSTGAFLSAKI